MRKLITLSAIFALVFLINQCKPTDTAVQVDISAKPFEKLSEYQFFTGNLADLTPNENVVPYDLNSPLFTDYAKKARFVWVPEGTSAKYTTEHVLDFPVGAVLIKNFYYENDETNASAGRRMIETRLLIHREKGWEAHSYVWNDAQTEAVFDIVGDIVAVDWKDEKGEARHVNYIIPNKNQCKGCHSYKQKLMPIGPKVRNLNKSYTYADGASNQLNKWETVGYLSNLPKSDSLPQMPVWDDAKTGTLHDRALAYLDINCGHCHNLHGEGGTTGLNLVYGAALDLNLGVNKPPVASGRASAGFDYSIVKGDPDHSILPYRMASTEAGVMMPELGRSTAHVEGVALIREWILAMK